MYLYLSTKKNGSDEIPNVKNLYELVFKLPKSIKLAPFGDWSIALVDIDLPKLEENYRPQYLVIFSSVCAPCVFQQDLKPVMQNLYYFQIRSNKPIIFENPRYVKINKEALDTIDLYITDENGDSPSFKNRTLACTLHIRKDT